VDITFECYAFNNGGDVDNAGGRLQFAPKASGESFTFYGSDGGNPTGYGAPITPSLGGLDTGDLNTRTDGAQHTFSDFIQGYVIINQPKGLVTQQEDGVWFTAFEKVTAGGNLAPQCTLTGTAVGVGGSRSLQLIIRPTP
jgi:hypothetical protein